MKRYLATAILMLGTFWAAAQNINSTVDVSNDYSASFSATNKQDIQMSSPDSLRQFRKDFDYSVFENPYKGSYEFVSDYVTPRDSNRFYRGRNLYLNAGAGWTMHPELQAVYSPVFRNSPNLQLSIFQDGKGYYGKYRGSDADFLNVSEKFGAKLHAAVKGMNFKAGLEYKSLFAGQTGNVGMMNSARGEVGFYTVDSKFLDVKADFNGHYAWLPNAEREAYFNANLTVEPKLRKAFRFPVDIEAGGAPLQSVYNFALKPHVRFYWGPVDLTAGVRLAYVNNPFGQDSNPFRLSPDVHANLSLLKGALTIFADVDGRSSVYSALDMLDHNHFITAPRSGVIDEKIRFQGGLRGRISSHFHYDLKGGYSIFGSTPLDVSPLTSDFSGTSMGDAAYNLIFADASVIWRSERVDANLGFHYRRTNLDGNFRFFDLPLISGSAQVIFNWERRIFVAVSLDASAQRVWTVLDAGATPVLRDELPQYFDLGAYAEYKFTRAFSVWLKGQNLLNQDIRRIPVYSEPGIYGTGGIKLNF